MTRYLTLISLLFCLALNGQTADSTEINRVLDAWHKAAARADFQDYFSLMADGGVFIGTDATEHWDKEEFMAFSRPYFEGGKAWDFTPLQRHVYIGPGGQIAWFDELLDTWMKLCRGSGVLVRRDGQWKIAHYVLSLAIPNDAVDGVIELKKQQDSILRSSLLLRQPN